MYCIDLKTNSQRLSFSSFCKKSHFFWLTRTLERSWLPSSCVCIWCLLRFEYQLPHQILCTTLATDKNYHLSHFHISYQNSEISWPKVPISDYQSHFFEKFNLPKLGNQLTKNGPNFSKKSALKIELGQKTLNHD